MVFARGSLPILLPSPKPTAEHAWGDYYFARSLREGLEGIGVRADLFFREDMVSDVKRKLLPAGARELVLRGNRRYDRKAREQYIWLISNPLKVDEEEFQNATHVFVASDVFATKLMERDISASVLHQCTDPEIFNADRRDPAKATDVLFVGIRRNKAPREVVPQLIEGGYHVSVWGKGWEGHIPEKNYAGYHVANEILGSYYASARVVVADHQSEMLSEQFPSNRIFDALACGVPVVTDMVRGLPSDILPFVYTYEDRDSLYNAVDQALAEGTEQASRRSNFARQIQAKHSFIVRANAIAARMGLSVATPSEVF